MGSVKTPNGSRYSRCFVRRHSHSSAFIDVGQGNKNHLNLDGEITPYLQTTEELDLGSRGVPS
jgi:hypothetical protein